MVSIVQKILLKIKKSFENIALRDLNKVKIENISKFSGFYFNAFISMSISYKNSRAKQDESARFIIEMK